ncbi:Uncharacterized protein FKW44_011092 [Caligus rogercresseyi]|uniref:Uncharacterized protein n=1 Tax=Caligus rogercresseyi TaxID=217165 RepID=A0A7T8HHH6_CALRO|nr:Uncharacterized protein FKW44_011092 [Caligus rogercresseyi]
MVRYRLATSSLFMNKSQVDPRKRSCHWCRKVEETSFHFFYFCPRVAPAIKAVEGVVFGAYGVMLTPLLLACVDLAYLSGSI